jgi:tetratricopeptide (TPR) repeat protein
MPVTIEALLEMSLSKVQDNIFKTVLQTKAFLPLEASEALWQSVSELSTPALEAGKRALEQQGIFAKGTFAHPLYREVVLKRLSKLERQHLARRALEVLTDDPEAAAGFIEDANLEPTGALELLGRAASKAREHGNEARAARFQARCVSFMQGEAQAKLAFETAVDLYAYDLTEAIRLLELAHQTQPENFEILERLALYLAQAGHHTEVERLLANLPPSERISTRGLLLLISVSHYLQEPKHTVELWDAHPELQSVAPPVTIRNVAFAKADLGDAAGALELASQTLSTAHLLEEERALLLETCGFACYAKSDFASAVPYYTEALDLFHANGQAHRSGSLLFNRALSLQSLARFSESLTDAESALKLAAEGGHARFYANAQLALAAAHLEQGDYERAEERLRASKTYYQQTGMTGWLVDAYIGLSEVHRDWKTPYGGVLARKYGEKALLLARSLNNPRYVAAVMPYTVMAEALYGNPQGALELATEGYRLCCDQDDTFLLARLMRARAHVLSVLGRSSEALSDFQAALTITQTIGVPLETAKIRLEIAHLTHDLTAAKNGLEWFLERGLMNGANIARHYFPELAEAKENGNMLEIGGRLEFLGSPQITSKETTLVRGRKRQECLALLLEARVSGKCEVSKLTLLDTLYAHENELRASMNLKNLVHGLRESFGDKFLITTSTGYALGSCSSDVELFLQTGDTALWRGEYLQGLELGSSSFDGDSAVREPLYLQLNRQAQSLLEANPKEAVRVAKILIQAEPYSTEYLITYFRALRTSNNHHTLTRHYAEARERMLEVGETLPEKWQSFLAA